MHMEDASDERAETSDELCRHDRCWARCEFLRTKPNLCSPQGDGHGYKVHQNQGRLRDRHRNSTLSFASTNAPFHGLRPNRREANAELATVRMPMEIPLTLLQMLRDKAPCLKLKWIISGTDQGRFQFCSWCRSCLAGARRDRAHVRAERPDERAIPALFHGRQK